MLAAFIIVEVVSGFDVFKPALRISAPASTTSGNSKIGDPVKMAGVPVGRVEKLALADNKVELVLRLNKGHTRSHGQQGDHQVRGPGRRELCLH